jgi:hypothetical protein
MSGCCRKGARSGQLSAAVAAGKEIGIYTGHRIERSEVGLPGEFESMQDDELERMVAERFHRLFGGKLAIRDGSATLNGRSDDE